MKLVWILLCLLAAGCGYHFQQISTDSGTTISIPYVQGDPDGKLTEALASALSETGRFKYVAEGGDLNLLVAIKGDEEDQIGYRFDRKGTSGKKRHRLEPIENRRKLKLQMSLIDASTQEILIDPMNVPGWIDYDYVDSHSIRDLAFAPPGRSLERSLTFSMGELDTIEGAHDASSVPLYREIAQKIAYIVMNRTHPDGKPTDHKERGVPSEDGASGEDSELDTPLY